MHPLPPPPGRFPRARDQHSEPNQPPIIPESSTTDHSSQQNAAPDTEGGKKKKRHRAGKKKRNRRQSFAAPSDDSTLTELQTNRTMVDAPSLEQSTVANKSLFRLGHSRGNLSSTSLDSEALLDHRYDLGGKKCRANPLIVSQQRSTHDAPPAREQIGSECV